jgi:crotonobetainyl-CoA:carnitine CoA-transferase CaiB-like acyl-CoA transferase
MGPLKDFKILDLSRLVAGNMAGMLLADLGAEVIKIEQPGIGDPLRGWTKAGRSLWWRVYARNKRCISLNFRVPEGRDLLKHLISRSDVLIENFVPGTMERYNLGKDVLQDWNPRLVHLSISGWGSSGPSSTRPGFGTLVEASCGLAAMTGQLDGPPQVPTFPLADMVSALYAVIGILAGLHHRNNDSGKGQAVDVSLFESLFSLLGPMAEEYSALGKVRERAAHWGNTAPRGCYRTSDGQWIAVSASTPKMVERLFHGLGLSHLLKDPRFATVEQRVKNVKEIDEQVSAAFAKHTLAEHMETIKTLQCTAIPVQTIREIEQDPHWRFRALTLDVEDEAGKVRMHNVFPRFSNTAGEVHWPGRPTIGYDNEAVYCGDLGLAKEDLEKLAAAGAI